VQTKTNNIMKNTFYADDYIYYTTSEMGWETEWEILSLNGRPVTDMAIAKEIVRAAMKDKNVGLATFEQMKMNNSQWDNL
jgi:hypothetical protein